MLKGYILRKTAYKWEVTSWNFMQMRGNKLKLLISGVNSKWEVLWIQHLCWEVGSCRNHSEFHNPWKYCVAFTIPFLNVLRKCKWYRSPVLAKSLFSDTEGVHVTTCCPPSFQLDGMDLKRRAEDQGIKCSQTRTDDDCCLESVNLPKGVVTATTVDDKYCHFVLFFLSPAKAVVVSLVP